MFRMCNHGAVVPDAISSSKLGGASHRDSDHKRVIKERGTAFIILILFHFMV